MLHTFLNYAFGVSEFDTPIKDPKLDGHFVERIRGSDRESSIGVLKKADTRAGRDPGGLENRQDPYSGHAVWGITFDKPLAIFLNVWGISRVHDNKKSSALGNFDNPLSNFDKPLWHTPSLDMIDQT